jgi:pantoate--beta-alanine ligase
LWMPSVPEMYPEGFATNISVSGLPDRLCGAARPGHFDGVATVVSKLFNQVRPDFAVFGEKDWQQLAIIRRMAADLDLGVEIVGLATQRAPDGLALSSRNAYLSDADRQAALALPQALLTAKAAIESGAPIMAALDAARAAILSGGFASVDYVEAMDAWTLEPLEKCNREGRLLAAARIGNTRLIDNFALNSSQSDAQS